MSRFILDSDVFIDAKNKYYAFLICPGFWDSLIYQHNADSVYSIDRVKDELLEGYDGEKKREEEGKGKIEDLKVWIKDKLPPKFFLGTDEADVINAYKVVMLWAHQNQQYTDSAEADFAKGADGWLVAYAMVHKLTVVTNEQPAPDSKKDIKIPDVCNHFNVPFMDTFEMLLKLKVIYELR